MRWRHRKVEFVDFPEDALEDAVVYSNGASPPHTIVVLGTYSPAGVADYDRLIDCTIETRPDGVTEITGISDHLLNTIRCRPEDSVLTALVWPNELDCATCQ